MSEIKALFLILFCSPMVVTWCCPVLAENEIPIDNSPIELIPLDASYDTNYKVSTDSISKADNNSQPLVNIISLRKIVPIIVESSINSKSAYIGNEITARLKEDLYYGRKLIAARNSVLKGCIVSYRSARTLSDATFQKEDRLKSSSAIGIRFNELVIDKDKSISLIGLPVHQESLRTGTDGYTYGISVDHQGRIVEAGKTLSKEQKDSYNILRVATNAPVPGGVLLNVVAAPVVMGAVGAASPELAFSKPLDRNVKHKRLKGMAYGFVTNLPGAFFVQAVVQKGNEVVLNSGDELMIDITINTFSNLQAVAMEQAGSETLAVKGQVLDSKPTKVRLLPASLIPYNGNSDGLALKPFIPSND